MADTTGEAAVPTESTASAAEGTTSRERSAAAGGGRKPADTVRSARYAAAFVLVFYLGMVAFMMIKRADAQWDHMNSLLGGLQAIVFGAAGVLFGTSIQRDSVARATTAADHAHNEAEQERSKSRAAERRAAGGEAMAAVARSTGKKAQQRASLWNEYRGEDDAAGDPDAENAEAELRASHASLVALADEYFPLAGKAGDGN
ncbi:hypothetical protein ABH920_007882 [Catenulispora sp. EB89]|uniref:hypothetical protein n=1 Tax=Catenulispora sp. EB89 TaxID=3156257 RepID=UPI00351467C8